MKNWSKFGRFGPKSYFNHLPNAEEREQLIRETAEAREALGIPRIDPEFDPKKPEAT